MCLVEPLEGGKNSFQDYLASDNFQEKDGKKEELNDDIPF
jgi:hypothetical protein